MVKITLKFKYLHYMISCMKIWIMSSSNQMWPDSKDKSQVLETDPESVRW